MAVTRDRRRIIATSAAAALLAASCSGGASSLRVGSTATTAGASSAPGTASHGPFPQPANVLAPTAATRTRGIQEISQAPFSELAFLVINQYNGPWHGEWVNIYAGGPRQAGGPVNGAGVRIFTGPADPSAGSSSYVGEFDDPTVAGPLKITAVAGDLVTLEDAHGSTVTFDLATRTF